MTTNEKKIAAYIVVCFVPPVWKYRYKQLLVIDQTFPTAGIAPYYSYTKVKITFEKLVFIRLIFSQKILTREQYVEVGDNYRTRKFIIIKTFTVSFV